MIGEGVPDNYPQSLSLEEIHYSEYITLCWWNVWTAHTSSSHDVACSITFVSIIIINISFIAIIAHLMIVIAFICHEFLVWVYSDFFSFRKIKLYLEMKLQAIKIQPAYILPEKP